MFRNVSITNILHDIVINLHIYQPVDENVDDEVDRLLCYFSPSLQPFKIIVSPLQKRPRSCCLLTRLLSVYMTLKS